METLAPRSPYDEDAIRTRRDAFRSGLVTAVLYGLFTFAVELYQGDSLAEAAVIAVLMGAFFDTFMELLGPVFGTKPRFRMPWSQADPAVNPELADGRYRYRLPCAWVTDAGRTVPGVLFVGKAGFRFVPHGPAPAGSGEPPVMEPLDEVQLSLVELPVTLRHQFDGQLRVPRIELRGPEGTARFRVPEEEAVFRRLRDAVAQMRAEPGVRAG